MLEHLAPSGDARPKVAILGGGGFIGGAIAARLRSRGIPITALTRAELDLEAPDAERKLAALIEPDLCIVFAAARAPARNVALLMQNLRMAETLCRVLQECAPGHLLYVSSDAVYADSALPVTEASETAPSTLHGVMHHARELMLKTATSAPIAFLRPTLIYGPDDPHGGYGPNRFWREAKAGGPIRIFGGGEERRDHIFIDDVAELAAVMIEHKSVGALNAVTGVATSFHDIAQMIAAISGTSVASIPRPGPRPHLLHRHFDATRRLNAFPRFRPTPLENGLRRFSL